MTEESRKIVHTALIKYWADEYYTRSAKCQSAWQTRKTPTDEHTVKHLTAVFEVFQSELARIDRAMGEFDAAHPPNSEQP